MGFASANWNAVEIEAVGEYISQWFKPLDGASLYVNLNCAACHGSDGSGLSGAGPDIRGLDASAINAAIAAGGLMSAVSPTWDPAEIEAVGTYISQWFKPLDGATVYLNLGCANCHGDDGSGISGPDIRGLDASAINSAIANGGFMGAVGASWSRAEIEAVGAYISQWSSPLDGVSLYVDLSCAACHGSDGSGSSGTPNIRGLDASAINSAITNGE